jgi:hypothetical protein
MAKPLGGFRQKLAFALLSWNDWVWSVLPA